VQETALADSWRSEDPEVAPSTSSALRWQTNTKTPAWLKKPTKTVGEEKRVEGERVGWSRKRRHLPPGGLNLRKGTLNPKSAAEWVIHSARSRKFACE